MTARYISPAGEPVGAALFNEPELGQRILMAVKDPLVRWLNKKMLTHAGYRVTVAENGTAAWEALQHDRYDLLVADQFLPKMSGVALLRQLHAASLTLPVIMATAVLPTWDFALNPCLQSVTMLRQPYTNAGLLDMVKKNLPASARVCAENAPLPASSPNTAAVAVLQP
jgi:DNA-binding NtrC family response regulator